MARQSSRVWYVNILLLLYGSDGSKPIISSERPDDAVDRC